MKRRVVQVQVQVGLAGEARAARARRGQVSPGFRLKRLLFLCLLGTLPLLACFGLASERARQGVAVELPASEMLAESPVPLP